MDLWLADYFAQSVCLCSDVQWILSLGNLNGKGKSTMTLLYVISLGHLSFVEQEKHRGGPVLSTVQGKSVWSSVRLSFTPRFYSLSPTQDLSSEGTHPLGAFLETLLLFSHLCRESGTFSIENGSVEAENCTLRCSIHLGNVRCPWGQAVPYPEPMARSK